MAAARRIQPQTFELDDVFAAVVVVVVGCDVVVVGRACVVVVTGSVVVVGGAVVVVVAGSVVVVAGAVVVVAGSVVVVVSCAAAPPPRRKPSRSGVATHPPRIVPASLEALRCMGAQPTVARRGRTGP